MYFPPVAPRLFSSAPASLRRHPCACVSYSSSSFLGRTSSSTLSSGHNTEWRQKWRAIEAPCLVQYFRPYQIWTGPMLWGSFARIQRTQDVSASCPSKRLPFPALVTHWSWGWCLGWRWKQELSDRRTAAAICLAQTKNYDIISPNPLDFPSLCCFPSLGSFLIISALLQYKDSPKSAMKSKHVFLSV